MKSLPQYLMPVPDRYRDGSFDVVVRDASSAVIFWDLTHETAMRTPEAQLAVRARSENNADEQVLNLHDHAGHLLLPLLDEERDYTIELGWVDAQGTFTVVSGEPITLPEVPPSQRARLEPPTSGGSPASMRHARYGLLTGPVERRGFRPGLDS